MEIIFLIALVWFWFSQNKKTSSLEARVETLESLGSSKIRPNINTNQTVSSIPVASEALSATNHFSPNISQDNTVQAEPEFSDRLIAWIKQDFMVKVGVLLLLIAFGWFVTYAFAHNWIGEVGRITLGLLSGVILLGLGVWRIGKFRQQGGAFVVGGATTILLTVSAAQNVYEMFAPISALALMFLTVVFLSFVSVRYRSQNLAFIGLIMASIAFQFTGYGMESVVSLFTYLLIVSVGTLWVVWITGWTRLTLTSLIITYLYSLPYLTNYGVLSDKGTVMMFSFVFVSMFFAANMVSLVRRHSEGDKHMLIHTMTALGTAIFLFSWIETTAPVEWKSLLYVSWSLVFAVGSYVVYSFTANYYSFYLYGATSIALIGIATAAELSGPALTIAYLLEVSLLIIAVSKLAANTKLPARLSYLMILPVSLSLSSLFSSSWSDSIFHEDAVVTVLTIVVLLMVGAYLDRTQPRERSEDVQLAIGLIFGTASLFIVTLVWLVFHALFEVDIATTLSLVVYTISGIVLFVSGKTNSNKIMDKAGSILVGGVILRLLFIDIWEMNMEGRIITFLVIGVLLISTAFIRKLQPADDGQPKK